MMVASVILSLLILGCALVFPGFAFLPRWREEHPVLVWARITSMSVTITVLTSLGAALIGLPQLVALLGILTASGAAIWRQRWQFRAITQWYSIVLPLLIFTVFLLVFSLPFFFVHDGLPTGDIQKSLIWSNEIIATNHFPSYERAVADYNRDPVDFYTPGLHTLLAYTQAAGPSLTSAGLFAISIALVGAGIAGALALELFPRQPAWLLLSATTFLTLTNVRYLRYLREPGYHVQNSVGELLLFGLVLWSLTLVKKWNWFNVSVAALMLVALALTHQFSAFIGAFALLPIAVALAVAYLRQHHSLRELAGLAGAGVIVLLAALGAGLHRKIPHIFSSAPHLLSLTPSLPDYFSLMGSVWLAVGIAGLVVAFFLFRRRSERDLPLLAFLGATLCILLLSQGPRLFIDIPPVRALFYSVIPLSIMGAYLLSRMVMLQLPAALLAAVVIVGGATSVTSAFQLSHTVRTNSTYLPSQQQLTASLQHNEASGGVLVDDYNRRSAAWLILSGRPLFTRIAADVAVQQAEAKQSTLRYQLYLNQLDFEKIFSLGSRPGVAELMSKHGIAFVTGIAGTSDEAFAHNPALISAAAGGDITLYRPESGIRNEESSITNWLLKTSTLVNDIGDREDTWLHLPASIRASRLSDPEVSGETTFRATTAEYIPLAFNVGDYVAALWSQEGGRRSDIDLELLVAFAAPPATPLRVITAAGTSYPVPADGSLVRIPARQAPFDDQGFITLTIANPEQTLVSFDLIALGLAHVP